MSAMTGIFKFDPRDRVDPTLLGKLSCHLSRLGPDGNNEFIRDNVGMAYRAFHTTRESHSETQPIVRGRCIMTWDGRLDNRVQLQTELHCSSDEEMTDIDLVFSAYKLWGDQCFRKLLGDWALVVWDEDRKQLQLARDYIGTRGLFYTLGENDIVWCTAPEPIVLAAGGPFRLDLNYIAGCLYPRPPLNASPYLRIRSVVPGTLLTISLGGRLTTERYWSLNPHAQIRYSSDEEYQSHFLGLLKESVRSRLRSDRTIIAESSGGLDSSSLVCLADQVRAEEPGSMIETLSYFDVEEPSGDERPYFTLIESRLYSTIRG
jgi:asparagine synthase (glutamine-hydrolysing)